MYLNIKNFILCDELGVIIICFSILFSPLMIAVTLPLIGDVIKIFSFNLF